MVALTRNRRLSAQPPEDKSPHGSEDVQAPKRIRNSLTPGPASPVDVLMTAPDTSEPTDEKKQAPKSKRIYPSTIKKSEKQKKKQKALTIEDLPNKLLLDVFACVASSSTDAAPAIQAYCRRVLPLVCKQWCSLLEEPSDVWKTITIDFSKTEDELCQSVLAAARPSPVDGSPKPVTTHSKSNRRNTYQHSRIERWMAARAPAVVSLTLKYSIAAKGMMHTFPQNGRGLAPLLHSIRSRLQELVIENCGDIFHPESFTALSELRSIRVLKIIEPKIAEYPVDYIESIIQLPELEELTLSLGHLTEFPMGLCGKLKKLKIQTYPAVIFPFECDQWRKLESLDLSSCALDVNTVVGTFSSLKSIKHLKLDSLMNWGDIHSDIWSGIQDLPELETLSMRLCGITCIPEGEEGFPKLKKLDLSNNYMGDEDSWKGLSRLKRLETLIARNTRTSAFPSAEFEELEFVTELDFSANALVDLSIGCGVLDDLRKLNLSSNCFPSIPKCVFQFDYLEELDLSRCIYLEVPRSMDDVIYEEGFGSLKRIDLRKFVAPYQQSSLKFLEELRKLVEDYSFDADVLF